MTVIRAVLPDSVKATLSVHTILYFLWHLLTLFIKEILNFLKDICKKGHQNKQRWSIKVSL